MTKLVIKSGHKNDVICNDEFALYASSILIVLQAKDLVCLLTHPHLLVRGHQRTVSTSKGCNQWLSLAKTLLKVAIAGGNCSLVAAPVSVGGVYVNSSIRNVKSGALLGTSLTS